MESELDAQGSSIVAVVLLAAVNDSRLGELNRSLRLLRLLTLAVLFFACRITGILRIENLTDKIDLVLALIISNRRNFVEDLLHTLVDEPLIRLLLVLDKVRHLNYFFDLGIRLSLCLALFYGMDHC